MTSLAKREANRRNGARSRGPRTPEGKQSAAGNALKHGLARPVRDTPEFAAELELLFSVFGPLGASRESLLRWAEGRVRHRHIAELLMSATDDMARGTLPEPRASLGQLARYDARATSLTRRGLTELVIGLRIGGVKP